MPSVDREGSRDRELVLKHQPSFSDSGRASVPMWDSSDPERAPPPLPLNPGSANPAARANTSASIAAAAEALTARARESTYITNPMPSRSPDKSLIKGQYQKRMQSLQNSNGNVRDLSSYLEGGRSPERSPEKIARTPTLDYENRSPERSPTRSGTPTSGSRDFGRDMPSLRPSTRPPPKAILGENTPTSATLLAIQNMPTPKDLDSSLSNITNGSTSLTRSPQTIDAISTHLLSLTSIATNLQREMTQLSRRSKDNATDLISLKEATNARDEDIRNSLRELVSNLTTRMLNPGTDHSSHPASHYNRGPGAYLLDNKPHGSPPGMAKSFSLPRIPSPNSFAATIERELANSSSPYSMDGAAGLALLEKILREMGTKEGQERVLATLSNLKDRPAAESGDPAVAKKLEEILAFLKDRPAVEPGDSALAKKLEEILAFLKDSSSSRALVSREGNGKGIGEQPPTLGQLDFESHPGVVIARSARLGSPEAQRIAVDAQKAYSSPRAADFVSEDILKMLKRIKDSVTEGGGLTAEIKALVRELRGEVLGMGREIGRKLEQAESTHGQSNTRGDAHGPGREEIAKIVEDGLAELKAHMDRVMRERRRESSSSSISPSTVDGQEVYMAVRNALKEMPLPQQVAVQSPGTGIEREEILDAVREAWETYKPEIELQNFGLERDEILQCLKEGLQEYQPQSQPHEGGGVSYEDVLDAVQKGLQHFKPPTPIETETSITREEILTAVRECLETFDFPTTHSATTREYEMIREDVLDAVKEGLSNQAPLPREIEVNREDLFDAVKAGLDGVPTPMAGVGEQVLEKMHELIEGMRGEFKQYSAANGRDTEQVLDAMKDGLEVLRADIETYVDRAADVTGKDEIIDTMRNGLEHLRVDLESKIANITRTAEPTNSGELLDMMEKEFEHLRQTIASSMTSSGISTAGREEILDAVRDGFEEMKSDESRSRDSEGEAETIALIKEEFDHLRETLATTMIRGGATTDKEEILDTVREGLDAIRADLDRPRERAESDISNTGELIDALNDGLDGLRSDIEKMVNKPLDMTVNYEILDALKEGIANVRADIDDLRKVNRVEDGIIDTRGGEVVIASEDGPRAEENLRRDDIDRLEIMITQLSIKVEALDNMPPPPPPAPAPQPAEGTVMKEDLEALETLLREVQASVMGLAARERAHDRNAVSKDDTDAIETLLRNTKAKLDEMVEPEGMARTEHLELVESVAKATRDAVEDVAARLETEGATKEDVSVLGGLLKDVHAGLAEIREKAVPEDSAEKVTKTDIEALESLCMDTKTQIEEMILPAVDTLPNKADIEGLGGAIKEFKDQMMAEADLTAQAFEARKIEHGGIADKVEEIKGFLDDVREQLKAKLDDGAEGIEDLAKTCSAIGEAIAANAATATIKELTETVTREFERAHGNAEGMRLDTEERDAALSEKHDEHKASIVAELTTKLEEKFNEIMLKFEDAQMAADEKASATGNREAQTMEALFATKAVAEDLKLFIDTLGAGVTESCDRMGEDSKTVFNRVEDMHSKLEDSTALLSAGGKVEHQLTRGEISKTLTAVEGVQAHINEYQPKILDSIKDVLSIVGQHYEQAQRSAEELKTSVDAIPSSIPMPALPAPLPSPPLIHEPFVPEKYDDTEVHAKLDKLVEHATEAGKSAAQLEVLEQIQQQVAATANDFSAFIAAQQTAVAETQDSTAREAAEAAIALSKRVAQKEAVEADIVALSSSKSELASSIQTLQKEKSDLATQKARLQADLSALQTALHIRREELQLMDSRAESLERRILDTVLDHSRSLLLATAKAAPAQPASLKSMSLKPPSAPPSPSAPSPAPASAWR
ncbi:hypothetical protein LPUS_02996 [Lasallia pustulata]|uniref:Chromosome segregation ATPase family protein n=1 Tax=Lasallia pustulata TaxID=136370 RepID=A0A1W5CTT8_9LECA|nr:hypothetical protein LPUS_02996 [Lasallia pustulata]